MKSVYTQWVLNHTPLTKSLEVITSYHHPCYIMPLDVFTHLTNVYYIWLIISCTLNKYAGLFTAALYSCCYVWVLLHHKAQFTFINNRLLWQCSTMVPLGDILYDLMYQMPKMSAFVYALCVYYVTLQRPYDYNRYMPALYIRLER